MVTETRAAWNDESDALLADLVQEQVLKGNRSQSGFKAAAWAEINTKINAERATGPITSTNQLKTRDQQIRKLHKPFPEVEGYLWFWLGRREFGSDSRGRRLGCFRTEISLVP